MRLLSFMHTYEQILARSKTVTRRMGWAWLPRGAVLSAARKVRGLRRGEDPMRVAVIRVVDVRLAPLRRMTDDLQYGVLECRLEGFGSHPYLHWPSQFVEFFCATHRGCTPESPVTRIAFEYVDRMRFTASINECTDGKSTPA